MEPQGKNDSQSAKHFAEHSAEKSQLWHFLFQDSGLLGTDTFRGMARRYVDTVEYKLGWTPLTCQKGLGISASTGIEAA